MWREREREGERHTDPVNLLTPSASAPPPAAPNIVKVAQSELKSDFKVTFGVSCEVTQK